MRADSSVASVLRAPQKARRSSLLTTHYKRAPLFRKGYGAVDSSLRKGTPFMDCKKYIGMDVHQATISIAVMDEARKW
jgi:hypothetical protein